MNKNNENILFTYLYGLLNVRVSSCCDYGGPQFKGDYLNKELWEVRHCGAKEE